MSKYTRDEEKELYLAMMRGRARINRVAVAWMGLACLVAFITFYIAHTLQWRPLYFYALPGMVMTGIFVLLGIFAVILMVLDKDKS